MELQKEKKILNESYGKDALEAPVNDIRNILEREVTWTALPTISGFAIIAWNVLNYFFTLLSSLMIFSKTNVPVYLLMKRTNTDFASGYLLYATIITVLWFYAVSRYNVEGRFVHIIGFFLVIIVALSDIVGVRSLIYGKVLSPMTFGAGVIFAYLLPAVNVLGLVYFEAEYKKILKEEKGKTADEETQVEKMVEDISKIKLVRKRRWLHLLCLFFIWFSFLTKEEFFSHCLVDQENRIIVADLGETYIAQDLVIKSEDDDFYIDTSHYYVIDASGENVRVVFKPRAEIKPLQYFE